MIYDCIIIGAGASGLMCAAAMKGPLNGLILEKTEHAGTKLLMSGSGPTVFGLCRDAEESRTICRKMLRDNKESFWTRTTW